MAERAGWMHNILGGYCKATGLKMGTVMVDLMKFYEHEP